MYKCFARNETLYYTSSQVRFYPEVKLIQSKEFFPLVIPGTLEAIKKHFSRICQSWIRLSSIRFGLKHAHVG